MDELQKLVAVSRFLYDSFYVFNEERCGVESDIDENGEQFDYDWVEITFNEPGEDLTYLCTVYSEIPTGEDKRIFFATMVKGDDYQEITFGKFMEDLIALENELELGNQRAIGMNV